MRRRFNALTASALCAGLTLLSELWAAELRQGMGVDEAYRAIPHERTQFLRQRAHMPDAEADYLDNLFALVDLAVVERVQTQRWMQSGGRRGEDRANHGAILRELKDLAVPDRLIAVHRLVVEAIGEQHDYFELWRSNQGVNRFDHRHPLIQGSHRKLIDVYNRLIRLYPSENGHNKKAFYDHLCALDFI